MWHTLVIACPCDVFVMKSFWSIRSVRSRKMYEASPSWMLCDWQQSGGTSKVFGYTFGAKRKHKESVALYVFSANFGGRRILLVRSKISRNKFLSFFFFVCVENLRTHFIEDLIKIIGADWKEFSDVDELHRVILFRWFLFVCHSVLNKNILFSHAKWTKCFGTWIVQIN